MRKHIALLTALVFSAVLMITAVTIVVISVSSGAAPSRDPRIIVQQEEAPAPGSRDMPGH